MQESKLHGTKGKSAANNVKKPQNSKKPLNSGVSWRALLYLWQFQKKLLDSKAKKEK